MKRFVVFVLALVCFIMTLSEGNEVFASTHVITETRCAVQGDNINQLQNAKIESRKTVEELVKDGTYMLRASFAFYKGSVARSKITSITFSRTAPSSYDESWNANLADTSAIKGYRKGTKVYIVGKHIYANTRSSGMFAGYNRYGQAFWSGLKEINGLELLNTSYVDDMDTMFAYGQFTELPGIENWDVSSVTDMKMMFAYCTQLTSLDVANWDVSSVEEFSGMFQGNSNAGDMKLQTLDVSRWDTSSAEDMSHVFYGCSKLTEIAVDNWDVSKVTTFSHMFADCYALQNLNLTKWETLSVKSFDAFLNDCRSLTEIDVSGLDTKTCTQFSQMFEACTNLEKIIGLETWDVSNASNYAFSETFHCCTNLKEANISKWKAAPDNTARMFKSCKSLETIDLTGLNMKDIETTTEMFAGCAQLKNVRFNGSAPAFAQDAFSGVTATAYYPTNDASWNQDVCKNYGGKITWTPYNMQELNKLPGDINGDGKVNNKDATRLFQYLSGWTVLVEETSLDVNGDGKINNKDATRLFQYLSGWEVAIY